MSKFIRHVPNIYRLCVTFPGCWTGVTLVTGTVNIMIDSGGCAETVDSEIVPALNELGISLDEIHFLALTHIHGDHVGGCARIHELAPAMKMVAFHESRERLRDPLTYSKAIRARFPSYSPSAPAVLDGVEPNLLLKDGDTIGDLRLLHTPGHDTDSCCYLDERTNTLITGDSLQLNGTCSQGCALLMDGEAYESTLKRLMQLRISNIVCGHSYLPLGAEAIGKDASKRFLAECAEINAHNEGFVHGMMAAGVTDPAVIAKELIREVGGTEPKHLFLPIYTVSEYIKKGVHAE